MLSHVASVGHCPYVCDHVRPSRPTANDVCHIPVIPCHRFIAPALANIPVPFKAISAKRLKHLPAQTNPTRLTYSLLTFAVLAFANRLSGPLDGATFHVPSSLSENRDDHILR
jgi:hypothetical protein